MNNVPVLSPVQSNLSLKFNLSKYQWNAIRVLLSCYHCAIYFDYWWRFHSGAFGEIGVCASISCLQMSDPSVSPPILSPATKNQAPDNIAAEDLHLAEHFSCSSLSGAFLLHHLPVSTMGGGCWKKGYWNYQSGRTVTLSSASSLSSAVLLVPPPSAWLASLLMRLFCLPEKHMLGSYLLKRFLTFSFAPSFHHNINQVLQVAILSWNGSPLICC